MNYPHFPRRNTLLSECGNLTGPESRGYLSQLSVNSVVCTVKSRDPIFVDLYLHLLERVINIPHYGCEYRCMNLLGASKLFGAGGKVQSRRA
jgi:hypothetical protein